MIPTPKLRFFDHVVPAPEYGKDVGKTVRTLQQWWQTNNTINFGFGGEVPIGETKGEWRNVPIEKEGT